MRKIIRQKLFIFKYRLKKNIERDREREREKSIYIKERTPDLKIYKVKQVSNQVTNFTNTNSII